LLAIVKRFFWIFSDCTEKRLRGSLKQVWWTETKWLGCDDS